MYTMFQYRISQPTDFNVPFWHPFQLVSVTGTNYPQTVKLAQNVNKKSQISRPRTTPSAMQTPLYKFSPDDYAAVYEPAEDSFLLLDALEDELEAIRALRPLVCLEIGPGSGIIISALAKVLANGALFLGVDINPKACRMTARTREMNECPVDVVNMDLVGGFVPGVVDLLVFNPPYVPTSEEDCPKELEEHIGQFGEGLHDLVKSWAGGCDGMAVTNRVLATLDRILSPEGVFYCLLVKENNPEDVIGRLARDGFEGSVVKERKIRGEHLFVLKIVRNKR